MNKIESVVAFGDSFFAGYGLIDDIRNKFQHTSIIELDQHTKPLSFPNLLAQKLGVKCYNYSMSASSNGRSLRKLFEFVNNNRIKLETSLVLFGYTSTDRHEYYDETIPVGKFAYLNQDEDNFIQTQTDIVDYKGIHPLSKSYICNYNHYYQNTDQQMFFVDAVFKKYSILGIHIPIFPYTSTFVPDNLYQFENKLNFIDWCFSKKYIQLSCKHFEYQAHEDLSKLLFKDLNSYIK